ncbi:MAG: rhomboid family intramembrane serine protease [Verrucomicrobiota bacterium]
MNDTDQEQTLEEWVNVGHFPTLNEAYDHGLVILAMGEACRVEASQDADGFDLHAEKHPAPRISDELDAYGRENALPVKTIQRGPEWSRYSAGWPLCLVWIAILLVTFNEQRMDASLVERGASSSVGLFARGEWWRPFTGLFLHADLSHLMGNLVGGAVFGALVSKMLGPWRAWLLILACGTVGNILTASLRYPEEFLSIGASTAVFAALGILSGVGLVETLRERVRLPWLRIAAPVVAGVVLLGWLGGGEAGSNTDVMGHVLGFGSGLVAGTAAGMLLPEPQRA